MPDNAKPASSAPKSNQPSPDAGHIPITEEMDSAKWTLPPVVAIVIAVVALSNRPKPYSSGNISKLLVVENGDNVLVAVHVNLKNAKDDYLWIKEINGEVETSDGKKYTDTAAPAVDVDHYLQAEPQLAEGKIAPLPREIKIPVGKSESGMVIFAFPVNKAAFDARKSFDVRVDFHDHSSLVLKQ